MRILLCTLFWIGSLSLAAEDLRVVATTQVIGEVVDRLAGDAVTLDVLMGPGVDPHLYKASASDVRALRRADLILYNGLHLEGQMTEIFERLNRAGTLTYAVAEAIPEPRRLAADDYAGTYDPHVWFDPALWALVVSEIERILAEHLPDQTATIAINAAALRTDLATFRRWAEATLADIPSERRVLVTSHDAFRYFGEAFDFEVVGIQGLSTATEAGLADITRVSDLLEDRGVPAIFIESSLSPATVEAVARQTGVKVGGELFSDSLGAAGEVREIDGATFEVGTLLGASRHNIQLIANGLSPDSRKVKP
jgi:manganese/zinc/iron transport system substrate-binding protein